MRSSLSIFIRNQSLHLQALGGGDLWRAGTGPAAWAALAATRRSGSSARRRAVPGSCVCCYRRRGSRRRPVPLRRGSPADPRPWPARRAQACSSSRVHWSRTGRLQVGDEAGAAGNQVHQVGPGRGLADQAVLPGRLGSGLPRNLTVEDRVVAELPVGDAEALWCANRSIFYGEILGPSSQALGRAPEEQRACAGRRLSHSGSARGSVTTASTAHLRGGAPRRLQDPPVGTAATQVVGERPSNLGLGRVGAPGRSRT